MKRSKPKARQAGDQGASPRKAARRPQNNQRRSMTPAPPSAPIRGAALSQVKAVELPAPEFPEITDVKTRAYLTALSITGRFDDAAKAAGVSLKTGWNWRNDKTDTAFQAALALALQLACDRIEAEITRRALDGVEEPVFQQGRLVGTIRKFSDVLLMFRAKRLMPEYRDKFEHSGPGGGPIQTESVLFYLPANGRPVRTES